MFNKSLILAAVAGASLAAAPALAAPTRPNIIVIIADDLGYGDTGAYGSPRVKTPNIDALAREGVRFTQGYVAHPVCAPSRAALLTGRYQTRFGYEFNPVGRDRTGGVSRDEVFLPQVLKGAGYSTGMVGKWHLGQPSGYHPLDRGFDSFFGIMTGATAFMTDFQAGDEEITPPGAEASVGLAEGVRAPPGATEAEKMALLRRAAPVYRGREVVEEGAYLTDAFTREAISFIDAAAGRPFFLYLAHAAPHTPLQAPARYITRNRDIPDKGQRVYAAMVTALDDGVGRIRAELKARDLERNTVIVFLSDNGCAGYIGTACTNGPLNGFKGLHLEGGVRVPYIISGPGRFRRGGVEDQVVSSLDILPTAAALAGATLPKGTDGENLVPYLSGPKPKDFARRLFWRSGPNYAVRDGAWKLWSVNRAEPGETESLSAGITPDGVQARVSAQGAYDMLYNLAEDPGESRNLAATRPEVVARLKAEITEWDRGNVPAQWTSMRQAVRRHEGQMLKIYP
jgi:arylsulfatase A-like enzyme